MCPTNTVAPPGDLVPSGPVTIPPSERTQPSGHYVTAATHFVLPAEPVDQPDPRHHFTLHCYCGADAYAYGDDAETAFAEVLAALHP